MLKKNKIYSILLLLVFVLGCSSVSGATPTTQDNEAGNGKNSGEDNAPVKDFDAITFDVPGILEIVQGETETLEILGDPAYVSAIRAEVKDRRLEISATSDLPSNASIRYKLVVKDINDIVLNSFGVIKIPTLKTKQLGMTITGSGRIQVGELSADSLTVEMIGAGNFSAEAIRSASVEFSSRGAGNISIAGGGTDQLHLAMESGSFIGDNFKSLSAVVIVNGTGTALVWTVEKLDVTVNGAGSVTYYGEPTMSMSMDGGGQIRGGGRK